MRVEALLALLPLVAAAPHKRAPLHIPRDVDLIEGKFIVKFKEPKEGSVSIQSLGEAVTSITSHADYLYDNIGGFASSLTEEEIETLRNDPNVSFSSGNRLCLRCKVSSQLTTWTGRVHRAGCRGQDLSHCLPDQRPLRSRPSLQRPSRIDHLPIRRQRRCWYMLVHHRHRHPG